ncbi:glycerophosphoryl diester phosphodiesterase [Nitzschia inconspicua]|uniref:Glycerophosphoryl diester phosphodiesterase n=1 Tax=Nitzschia inconspicua TaxID=303405 RepID=A0A9K3PWC9_9STRA|nr:glycerophosphoryl diester phosphodiesterase [Nitzschia inconspicua]
MSAPMMMTSNWPSLSTLFSLYVFLFLLLSTTSTTVVVMLVTAFVPYQQNRHHHNNNNPSHMSCGSSCSIASTSRRIWIGQAVAITTTTTTTLGLVLSNNENQNNGSSTDAKSNPQPSQSLQHVLQVGDVTMNISSSSSLSPSPFPAVVGHRGCLYDALENTREGFQQCMAMGCDAVELDVFALKCGTLVIFHGTGTDENPGLLDGYLVGSTFPNGNGILDYTYEQLLQQDWTFNINNEEFPCPKDSILRGSIPTLEQVFRDVQEASSNMHLTLELKGGYNIPEQVLQLVDQMNMVHQTSCSSFNLEYLQQVRALRPERDDHGRHLYKTGVLVNDAENVDSLISKAHAVEANEIHLRYDTCTRDVIDKIHRQGFGSMAWFRGPVGMQHDSTMKYTDVGNEDELMYHVVAKTGVQRIKESKSFRILVDTSLPSLHQKHYTMSSANRAISDANRRAYPID